MWLGGDRSRITIRKKIFIKGEMVLFYTIVVRPATMCGTLSKNETIEIKVSETITVKWTCDSTLLDRNRNERIRESLGHDARKTREKRFR